VLRLAFRPFVPVLRGLLSGRHPPNLLEARAPQRPVDRSHHALDLVLRRGGFERNESLLDDACVGDDDEECRAIGHSCQDHAFQARCFQARRNDERCVVRHAPEQERGVPHGFSHVENAGFERFDDVEVFLLGQF
jgi:hypothetical protein